MSGNEFNNLRLIVVLAILTVAAEKLSRLLKLSQTAYKVSG